MRESEQAEREIDRERVCARGRRAAFVSSSLEICAKGTRVFRAGLRFGVHCRCRWRDTGSRSSHTSKCRVLAAPPPPSTYKYVCTICCLPWWDGAGGHVASQLSTRNQITHTQPPARHAKQHKQLRLHLRLPLRLRLRIPLQLLLPPSLGNALCMSSRGQRERGLKVPTACEIFHWRPSYNPPSLLLGIGSAANGP